MYSVTCFLLHGKLHYDFFGWYATWALLFLLLLQFVTTSSMRSNYQLSSSILNFHILACGFKPFQMLLISLTLFWSLLLLCFKQVLLRYRWRNGRSTYFLLLEFDMHAFKQPRVESLNTLKRWLLTLLSTCLFLQVFSYALSLLFHRQRER